MELEEFYEAARGRADDLRSAIEIIQREGLSKLNRLAVMKTEIEANNLWIKAFGASHDLPFRSKESDMEALEKQLGEQGRNRAILEQKLVESERLEEILKSHIEARTIAFNTRP